MVNLKMRLGDLAVILIVEIRLPVFMPLPTPESTRRSIRLQVHPGANSLFLPADLQLAVVDASGNVFLQACSRSIDNYIQLQFAGSVGEIFNVQVNWKGTNFIESFVI